MNPEYAFLEKPVGYSSHLAGIDQEDYEGTGVTGYAETAYYVPAIQTYEFEAVWRVLRWMMMLSFTMLTHMLCRWGACNNAPEAVGQLLWG